MTKTTGMGDQFLVSGYDIGGAVNSLSRIACPMTPIVQTDITQYAMARTGGIRDGAMDAALYFPATGDTGAPNDAYTVFSALPRTDALFTYAHGYTRGNPSACMVGKQLDYNPTRNNDGSLLVNVSGVANGYGLEWGVQVSAGKQTDTTATDSTAYDQTTVSTAFGWQAYLHVTALTGTNVIVTLQDSANNSAFTDLASGAFTSKTAIGWQRLAGGATDTVRRYIRVSTSGTFTSASFFVMFVRNTAATVF